MRKLTFPTSSKQDITLTLSKVEPLAEMPVTWVKEVRAGREVCNVAKVRLCFEEGRSRNVYCDSEGLFMRGGGARVRLPKWLLRELGNVEFWGVSDVPPKEKLQRRKRSETRKMPNEIDAGCVVDMYSWPLGAVMTNKAAGEGWTDCLLILEERIRVGGRHNSRRVRYDGRFYITYNNVKRYLSGSLVLEVFECVGHVYGVNRDEDVAHNKKLKGY